MRTNAVKTSVNLVTLTFGGHIAAGMMYGLSHNRLKITKRLDAMHDALTGHKLTEAEQAHREARYAIVGAEPPKSAARMIGARVAGMATLLAVFNTVQALDPRRGLGDTPTERETNNKALKGTRLGFNGLTTAVGHAFAPKVEQLWQGAHKRVKWLPEPMPDTARRNEMQRYWGDMFLTEMIATHITASTMEFVAKIGEKKKPQPYVPTPAITAQDGERLFASAPRSTSEPQR